MEPSSLNESPAWAAAMLREARVGHLGMLDGAGWPRVLPVTYAVVDGLIYTAVDDKPKAVAGADLARVRYLRRRPETALVVDHYDDDWENLAWVQVLGSADLLDVTAAPDAIAALRARYEHYRVSSPRGPVIRLTPQRCLCWRASAR
jgi:PPOX class probable F420-dependent enzyme